MIFVDSGGWFASVVTDDDDYEIARIWLEANKEPLFTTDYIVDETLTLLRARGENQKALEVGNLFFRGLLAKIYYLSEEDILQTWKMFQQFSDKKWSLPIAQANLSAKNSASHMLFHSINIFVNSER